MTIKQTLLQAREQLIKKKIKSANLDADLILSYILRKPREFIYTHPEKNLTLSQQQLFKILIKRCESLEPIAYIIKQKEFYQLKFHLNHQVLIPRPETELMIDEAVKQINNLPLKKITLLDLGTGSGCIAVTLAKIITEKRVKILASDLSIKALKVAKQNACYHKVGNKIKFFQGNLMDPVKTFKIDIICANLPYLSNKEIKFNKSHNLLKFEPKQALFSGNSGLRHYQSLLRQISRKKDLPRLILFEINHKQKQQIKNLFNLLLPSYRIACKTDLHGQNRLMIAANN